MITREELLRLAEAWRGKAARLRQNYRLRGVESDSAACAALALETCAEDLEAWVSAETPRILTTDDTDDTDSNSSVESVKSVVQKP